MSDREHRKRQLTVVKEWQRGKEIGQEAFGAVWEEFGEDGNTRVVKENVKVNSGVSLKLDHQIELLTLGRQSKVRVQASCHDFRA